MVQNLLNSLSGGGSRGWNFEVPQINNLLDPIQQGVKDYRAAEQRQVENQRAERGLAIQEGQFGLQKSRFDEEKAQRVRERAGNLALLTLQEPDEGRRAQRWQQVLSTHPNAAGLDPKYHDPRTGPMAVLADAGMAQQYLDYQMRIASERRAAAADGRAAAMHPHQLEAARIQAETAKRDFQSPRATADINAGHSRIIYDPRTGQNIATIAGPPKSPDATDRKALWEAQDELPNLKGAVDALEEARSLLPKVLTGYTADARATFNQAAPSFLPNMITNPDSAKATMRYGQIMNAEAINAMSAALKGATTDSEMRAFVKIMSDPNTPVDLRNKTIESMLAKARAHYDNKRARIGELGGRVPQMTTPGAPAPGGADPLGIR